MTPAARIQAAIQLLDSILSSWQSEKRIPADKALDRHFKANRYIGSKDRGTISELIYWVLRHKAALEWYITPLTAVTARTLVFTALMLRGDYDKDGLNHLSDDGKYTPSSITSDEMKLLHILAGKSVENRSMPDHVRLNYPEWTDERLRKSFGDQFETAMRTLNEQAPTDLRVNTLKTTREALQKGLAAEGFDNSTTPMSPVGLRLSKRGPIFTSRYFKEGCFEVQDEGSQIIALLTDAAPGQRVIDFCAGAGGKTLAIAAAMENKGRILAWDTSEKRLSQIKERLRRAGVDNVQIQTLESEHDSFIKRHKQSADRVLVDAPCSGSGTWRRNPDLKWRFTPHDLEEITVLQRSILHSAARLVKKGGRLIYATCSVFPQENEEQIEKFLTEVSNFRVVCAQNLWNNKSALVGDSVSYLWLTPHQDGTDGFFAAVLERVADES
ncbi:MAG: RsmB/NOP family class I SAM-dependent RNA methyltransferase [Rickettsiales bacterium]|nr:RsmB/NOP family class I SAM-dependent RNA methyltransferase [Rickettsiales bacterium]